MSRKKILILPVVFLLLFGCESGIDKNETVETTTNNLQNKEKKETIKIDENVLLSNIQDISLTPRVSGTDGEVRASKFISEKLSSYGYNVQIQDFPIYSQDKLSLDSNFFELNPLNTNPLGYGQNILAKSNNFDKNKKSIYITAHYDSDPNTIGVIDNATGVSSAMEIARVLEDKDLPFNVQIIFFSAEESRMYGSRYFVSNLPQDEKNNILGVINIDMVGEKDAGDIIVQTSRGRNNILSKVLLEKNNIKLLPGGSSDEYSFYLSKIPSITLTNENSKTFDGEYQFEKLDIKQLHNLSQSIVDFIYEFNLSEYYDMVNTPKYNDIKISSDESKNIYDYVLSDKQEILLENGYDSSTIYTYTDSNDKKYLLTESDSRFISETEYKEFKILDSDNGFMYKIDDSSIDGNVTLYYKWGYIFGELKSNESLIDSLSFLDNYYINYYENIFGDKPTNSIK